MLDLIKKKKKQRTTTDSLGNSYMERGCATDCTSASKTNGLYNSNIPGVRETVVNICCQNDYCNASSTKILTNKFFFILLIIIHYLKK